MTELLATNNAPQEINDFHGHFYWLSNFSSAKVCLDGEVYPTVEHAFQAAKTDDPELRRQIRKAPTPGKAKKLGKTIPVAKFKSDWDKQRIFVMYYLLRQKFVGQQLQRLQDLKGVNLVEGNTWGDKFWGVCDGEGYNVLGQLLMMIRDARPTDYIDVMLNNMIVNNKQLQ